MDKEELRILITDMLGFFFRRKIWIEAYTATLKIHKDTERAKRIANESLENFLETF